MTLFVSTTPSNRYEVSDVYIMALGFITGLLVIKVTKLVVKKQ